MTRSWGFPEVFLAGDLAVGGELTGVEMAEFLAKALPHFGEPLRDESLWRHDQDTLHEAAQLQLADDETGLDRLAEAHLVGEEVTHPSRMGQHLAQCPDLVGQWHHRRIDRREELVVVEQVEDTADHRRELDLLDRVG